MNKNFAKNLKNICMAVCVGIGAVQVCYALLWAFQNGTDIQDFYDTSIYIENALLMNNDGWRLPAYSLFVRVFLDMQGSLGDCYLVLLYLTQVTISLLCFAGGCKTLAELLYDKKVSYVKMFLPAGYILTIPIVWQMQFAVLPDALCVAITVLMVSKLATCLWKYRKAQWDAFLVILGCLCLLGVMHRHYFYGATLFCVACSLILLIRNVNKKYRCKEGMIAAGALFVCVIVTAVVTVSAASKYEKDENYVTYSLAADLLDSFVYPNIREDYQHYPGEVHEILPKEYVEEYGDNYERYMIYIASHIEEADSGAADRLYLQMVKTGISLHGKEIASKFIKEAVAYHFLPFAMVKYMYFNGNSLYGHNLMKMYEATPKLTVDYMHTGMIGFGVISLLGIITCVADAIVQKDKRKHLIRILLFSALNIFTITLPIMLLNVLRFDYRYGLVTVFVWGSLALLSIWNNSKKDIN